MCQCIFCTVQFRLELKHTPTCRGSALVLRAGWLVLKDKQDISSTLCCAEGSGFGDHFPIDF